mmetsp:Transcript_12789/g.16803  ORF Transcript_12789/g.16803 Transcript_12789/m.16803 type:complete len:454 (-) Transcript_12789:302-1663(-)
MAHHLQNVGNQESKDDNETDIGIQQTGRNERVDLDCLMGVRALASLQVAVGHYYLFTREGFDLQGGTGVTVFFVVSGFVMTIAYLDKCDQPGFSRYFFIRRAGRIYPLHWFGLAILIPVLVVNLTDELASAGAVWWSLGLILTPLLLQCWLPGVGLFWNGVSWSMSVQVFFYMVFGCLARRLKKRWGTIGMSVNVSLWVWYGISLVILLLLLVSLGPESGYWVSRTFPLFRLPTFCMGMVAGAACLKEDKSDPDHLQKWARVTDMLSVIIFLLIFLASLSSAYGFSFRLVPEFFGSIIFAYWLRGLAESNNSRTSRFLKWKSFKWLGELSFAMYVLQLPVWTLTLLLAKGSLKTSFEPDEIFYMFEQGTRNRKIGVPLLMFPFMILLIAVSYLACRFIERPCRLWIARKTVLVKAQKVEQNNAPVANLTTGPQSASARVHVGIEDDVERQTTS